MTVIKPFRALRPVPEKAKQVSCVPYDVVYESEVRQFIGANELSFLRVTRAEAEFPAGQVPQAEAVFERAHENLQKFIDDGILIRDNEPSFYVYRLSGSDHSQTGLIACCSLDEYESGQIKKHENIRPDKVRDRTGHMLAVGAQTGLIFLAFRGTSRVHELLNAAVAHEPIYDFTCAGNIQHTFWKVDETASWIEAFGEVPALYIADGHHRAESASLARKALREKNPEHTGAEDYNYVVAGLYPAEDLQILAYNRVVKDLCEMNGAEFFARITEYFTITETEHKVPEKRGEMCMYLAGRWYKLVFNFQDVPPLGEIERLDVSILQDFVLTPILRIDDPRTDKRIGFIGGARGTAELEKTVDEGVAAVAFSMFPTTMEDLLTVSDMNEIMPPKSTWFEPKLKDGLIVHEI